MTDVIKKQSFNAKNVVAVCIAGIAIVVTIMVSYTALEWLPNSLLAEYAKV